MNNKDDKFEVLSVEEMRKKYYLPNEQPPLVTIDPENVPKALRGLIPLAERWGISDDILRWDARQRASAEEFAYLKEAVARFDDELDVWLAGPGGKEFEAIARILSVQQYADGGRRLLTSRMVKNLDRRQSSLTT